MTYRWVPLWGQFDISDDQITFNGKWIDSPSVTDQQSTSQAPSQPERIAAIGLLIADQTMVNGSLSATVKFDDIIPQSVCELILGYDVKTRGMLTAGLGGNWQMFSIREWLPASAPQQTTSDWKPYEIVGDRANLKANVPYDISISLIGSNISLDVDGVQVITATLPTPNNQPRQVGIFCCNSSNIIITNFRVKTERPRVFIVMQFSSPYNEVYSDVIKSACEEFSVEAVRADEIYGPGMIIQDVTDRIVESQVIIADISPSNPNVYFEVGYAHALGKPIILLAQRRQPDNPLPFDLSAFRVLFYDDNIAGKARLEDGLRNHLREILGST